MAKKVVGKIKLHVPGGQANPAPPVGPALGQHGVNIMEFCQQCNSRTREHQGTIIPVEIEVYADRSFSFITKTPPASILIKEAAGLETASGIPNREKVGNITLEDVREIAETKMPDLNTRDIEAAMRMVAGTARSMGIEVGAPPGREYVRPEDVGKDEESDEPATDAGFDEPATPATESE